MSAVEKLAGAGALVMGLCRALLPLAGAAIGGGLIAGAGTVGVVAGIAVLAAVAALVTRKRSEVSTALTSPSSASSRAEA